MSYSVDRFIRPLRSILPSLEQAYLHLTRPSRHSVVLATALDVTRSKAELVAENALLRQQLVILNRLVKKPRFTQADRLWLLLLASRVQSWKEALSWPKTPSSENGPQLDLERDLLAESICLQQLSWRQILLLLFERKLGSC